MKKNKRTLELCADGSINVEAWLNHLAQDYPITNGSLIRQATALAQLTCHDDPSPLLRGLHVADILCELHVDQETLAAGILYGTRGAGLSLEDVKEQFPPVVAKLIAGVHKMDATQNLLEQISQAASHTAIDNLRKMLLAIVDDVRIVLIKLAERLEILRHPQKLTEEQKRKEAQLTHTIYAPLANRLGIGHLKWELEDLSFRYLETEIYRDISKALKATRIEREEYVHQIIHLLKDVLKELGIENCEISGRAKHIYSIYHKMLRKKVPLEEIYDITAFRILVPNIENCYAVLGYIHSLWKPISKEFDDYIIQPKPNGYRSIHTAIIGPEEKPLEIQMRTFDMHQEAELGVAAHWIYKEGRPIKTGYEDKIAWLRQVMEWQKEISQASKSTEEIYAQLFEDLVYVFTPAGEVVELAQGATPLDFAYHIHTELGHRCRGAKVNGHMVSLTYKLQMGECVEILKAKESHPSRDWLNPHLGYLKTTRAKAKVHHWFRQQATEKNLQEGQAIIEKEVRRLGVKGVDYGAVAKKMHLQNATELFSAYGNGMITLAAVINTIQEMTKPPAAETTETITIPLVIPKPAITANEIEVSGVGNLLTHTALCCKPIPGDPIVGYITQGHGVSIHRQDCNNILHLTDHHREKLIETNWGVKTANKYSVDLSIFAYDRQGLIRDLTQLLVNEQVSILGLNCNLSKKDHIAHIQLSIEVQGLMPLSRILARIQQIPNVTEAHRV